MAMRLANDLVTLSLGTSQAVRLRPTLRAAYRLHAQHDLRKLMAGIIEGNFGMIADTLYEATDADTARQLVRGIAAKGAAFLPELVDPLLSYAFALLGADRQAVENSTAESKPADNSDWITPHLESLFEIASGWLGWSPADAWGATPTEIQIAYRGHIAKLKAIHGTTEKPAFDPREVIAPEQVKAGVDKLRALATGA